MLYQLVHIGHIKLYVLLLVNELLLELQEDRFARLGTAGRVHQGRSKFGEQLPSFGLEVLEHLVVDNFLNSGVDALFLLRDQVA